MHGQQRLPDEDWFARYGRLVGATTATGHLPFEDESEFASIVRPLEDRYGRPLTGHGRLKCHRAFQENPESFRRLAERALEQAHRNPVGLLIKMVRDGEHRFWSVGSVEHGLPADDEPCSPKTGA